MPAHSSACNLLALVLVDLCLRFRVLMLGSHPVPKLCAPHWAEDSGVEVVLSMQRGTFGRVGYKSNYYQQ